MNDLIQRRLKKNENRKIFIKGMKDAVPIGLGYFAVAFSLGIVAGKAGLDAIQGFLISFLYILKAFTAPIPPQIQTARNSIVALLRYIVE